jgi:hypothetical protein
MFDMIQFCSRNEITTKTHGKSAGKDLNMVAEKTEKYTSNTHTLEILNNKMIELFSQTSTSIRLSY